MCTLRNGSEKNYRPQLEVDRVSHRLFRKISTNANRLICDSFIERFRAKSRWSRRNGTIPARRACWLGSIVIGLILTIPANLVFSQNAQFSDQSRTLLEKLPDGFHQIDSSQHLTVVTDLPIDDEIRQLPGIFDNAMNRWCEFFDMPAAKCTDWHATMYVMLDRARFRQAGLIPPEVPEFQHGWQSGDKIWIAEQPSPYYRRHLMLHEGTHWFMFRKFGKYHAPWLMEGLAELLGTHRIENGVLEMGIIPRDKLEVPFWGRTLIIQEQTSQSTAPSLESILHYSNSAHQNVEAYAWSWALTLFLQNHPDSSAVFTTMLRQAAMDTPQLDRWLRSRLRQQLPQLRADWIAFVSDLDYGYTTKPGLLMTSSKTCPLNEPVSFDVAANRGWQATGVRVAAGQKFRVRAEGEFVISQQPKPWRCDSDGVTLEYFRSQPLGKLLMAILQPIQDEPATTEKLKTLPIGSSATLAVEESGEVFFRVNESIGNLVDNSGDFHVTIAPQP